MLFCCGWGGIDNIIFVENSSNIETNGKTQCQTSASSYSSSFERECMEAEIADGEEGGKLFKKMEIFCNYYYKVTTMEVVEEATDQVSVQIVSLVTDEHYISQLNDQYLYFNNICLQPSGGKITD